MSEAGPHLVNLGPQQSLVRVLLEAPIHFDVPGGTIHSPMVEAKVGGARTKLILDTGATAHVLTLDLAARARLAPRPADPGTDHTGAPVSSWSLGAVPIEVAGSRLDLQEVQAIDGPPSFEQWGVGGFLSPHGLDAEAWAVIDLVGNRVLLVDCDERALAAWLEERFPTLQPLSVEREIGEAVRIRASVEPFPPTVAMVNTGTPDTEFVRAALPGLEGTPARGAGFGVSGAEVAGGYVAGQVLRVGDWTCPVEGLFIRHERAPEHPDGQIGMDVLSGTVLAICPDVDQPIHWMVPNEPGRLEAN